MPSLRQKMSVSILLGECEVALLNPDMPDRRNMQEAVDRVKRDMGLIDEERPATDRTFAKIIDFSPRGAA